MEEQAYDDNDFLRHRVCNGDPEIKVSQHNNGEFTLQLRSGVNILKRRISKAEANRFSSFIKSRRG